MPAASAAVTPAISPSVCIIRVKPVGAIPNGSATRSPSTIARGVDARDVAQDRGVELHVGEGLARPGQRHLAVGGAVGVVERRLRRTPLGDPAQVLDRQRGGQPPLLRREGRLLELQQRPQVVRLGQLALHRGSSGLGGVADEDVRAGDERPQVLQACPTRGRAARACTSTLPMRGRLDRAREHGQAECGRRSAGTAVRSARRRRRRGRRCSSRPGQRRPPCAARRRRPRPGSRRCAHRLGGRRRAPAAPASAHASAMRADHVARRQEARVVGVEDRDRARQRRRLGEQRRRGRRRGRAAPTRAATR